MEWLKWLSACLASLKSQVQTPVLPKINKMAILIDSVIKQQIQSVSF
jgi:hypothetical protein